MDILCLIDSLGSGGAQRQMSLLVRALVDRGHSVRLVTYYERNHFLPDVISTGVTPVVVQSSSKFGRLMSIRKVIRGRAPDCIISFLRTPNWIGLFSSLGGRRIPIIVSERSLSYGESPLRYKMRFNAYRYADRVVCNSGTQAAFIAERFHCLVPKLRVVRNCIDLDEFKPRPRNAKLTALSLLVGASVRKEKNVLQFIRAMDIVNRAHPGAVEVDWFGSRRLMENGSSVPSRYYEQAVELVHRFELQGCLRLQGPVAGLNGLFAQYDAACLPSVIEGCPNFVCEAMASGLPVLASHVSEIPGLLGSAELLFDPTSPEDIAAKIDHLRKMTDCRRDQIGFQNRARAESMLGIDSFGDAFDEMLSEIVR